jgi:hypothetical protein
MAASAQQCHSWYTEEHAGTTAIGSNLRMERVDRLYPERAGLEAYIAETFFTAYGAEVRHFCDHLIGCRDSEGRWVAALGFTFAGSGKTFLEHYLDVPLERAISSRVGEGVERRQVVEVGNLAASHVGAARTLIACTTEYLYRERLVWVAFTATRGLLNSFTRLKLNPRVITYADPLRLPDGGKSWGSYYSTKPQVMFGDIRSGYAQLAKQFHR